MTDPIELRLHSAFKSAPLPPAPDSLRDFLVQLPAHETAQRRTFRTSPLLIAATLGLLLLGALSAIYIGSLLQSDPPPPTPPPTVAPTTPAASLLAEVPGLELILARSAGTPGDSISADRTSVEVSLGAFELDRPFLAALRCDGPGVAALRAYAPIQAVPSGQPAPSQREPILNGEATCNGDPQTFPYLSPFTATDVSFVLTVPAGASWRAEVGAFRPEIARPPTSFGLLEAAAGWTVIQDFEHHDLLVPGYPTGVSMNAPPGAELLAVTLWCSGTATTDVSLDGLGADVICPTPESGERVEFDLTGSEFLDVTVSTDAPIWLRLLLEVDRIERPAYGSPPPMPDDLASVSYAEVRSVGSSAGYLARGRLGASSTGYIEVPGVVGAKSSEDVVIVAISDAAGRQRLELWSIDSTEPIRTLAESAAPAMLGDFWIDGRNEQLFYSSLAGPYGPLSIHRVALDGSGRKDLAEFDLDQLRGEPEFALDGSVLITDRCDDGSETCTRAVIDTRSLAVTEYVTTRPRGDCQLLGATAELIVSNCFADSSGRLSIQAPDGSELREIPLGATGASWLVQSSSGLVALMQNFDSVAGLTSWTSLNISDGTQVELVPLEESVNLYPIDADLPAGWVLLAGSELTDFPGFQTAGRPVARLINVLTGQVIELVHLAHDIGAAEGF